eukprot:7923476-Pyramimonas_sp.AAC.1
MPRGWGPGPPREGPEYSRTLCRPKFGYTPSGPRANLGADGASLSAAKKNCQANCGPLPLAPEKRGGVR